MSTEKIMHIINPFYIQNALDSIAGKVNNVSRLKSSILLVDVSNDKQADILLKASLLGSCPIQVERHTSLNSSQSIVTTNSLDGVTDGEIQSTLPDQSVS
jgi:hypothetical protein